MATWLYHQTEPPRVFADGDVVDAIASGWADTPAAFLDEDCKSDADEREALIEAVRALGIEPDKRWGVKRLQKAIDDNRA